VRARVRVTVADDRVADDEWSNLSDRSRALYGIEPAPARSTPEPAEMPSQIKSGARDNFAVLQASVTRLEWLFLFHEGHRRAIFEWADGAWQGSWLVP
jgi:hypothetical protein